MTLRKKYNNQLIREVPVLSCMIKDKEISQIDNLLYLGRLKLVNQPSNDKKLSVSKKSSVKSKFELLFKSSSTKNKSVSKCKLSVKGRKTSSV